jgi:hypothetical protein
MPFAARSSRRLGQAAAIHAGKASHRIEPGKFSCGLPQLSQGTPVYTVSAVIAEGRALVYYVPQSFEREKPLEDCTEAFSRTNCLSSPRAEREGEST